MRVPVSAIALGVLLSGAGLSPALALPDLFGQAGMEVPSAVHTVQMACDQSRCIDPRTGAYTQSGCNRRGCYPIGGVVGYEGRGRAYGRRGGYAVPEAVDPHIYGRRYIPGLGNTPYPQDGVGGD